MTLFHSRLVRRCFGIVPLVLCCLATLTSQAQDLPKRRFDVPAGEAEKTLKLFSEQAGRGLIVGTEIVQGIRTNAVSGELSVGEALNRMLVGTGLVAAQDVASGALTVRKETPEEKKGERLARTAGDQPKTSANEGRARSEGSETETVELSKFVVSTTQGAGYSVGNSASALKSAQPVMNIPMQIVVISNDMIKDIGANATTDILQFAGINTYFRGEAVAVRGNRIGNPYIDDMPDNMPYQDNSIVDSLEVIKGPAQILYPGASLGGIVLKTTKKPQSIASWNFAATVDQWGGYRGSFDLTGPLGQLGDVKLSYRLVGSYGDENRYYRNDSDRRGIIFPSVKVDVRNTTVIASYERQRVYSPPGGTGILTPTGDLYTGAGSRELFLPKNDVQTFDRHAFRTQWIQRFTPNWEMKAQVLQGAYNRFGVGTYPQIVNWNNRTLTYSPYVDDLDYQFTRFQDDIVGKYTIAGMRSQSTFGASYGKTISSDKSWTNRNPNVVVPIAARAAETVTLYDTDNRAAWTPPTKVPRNSSYATNVYYMHELEPIQDRLILVAGLSFSDSDSINVADASLPSPYTATETYAKDYLHRLGIIWRFTKNVEIYANESTSFSGNSGVDINNNPLDPVQGVDREIGLKTALFDGRLSSTFSVFEMKLTNQTANARGVGVNGSDLNIAGQPFKIVIGDTTTRGWDAVVSFNFNEQWQAIATAFQGTVKDGSGNPFTRTYENSWSIFARYDFAKQSALNGLAFGGGASRVGGKWYSMSGLVLPGNAPLPNPALFKLRSGTMMNAFATYKLNRHFQFRLNCANVLGEDFPIGAQGVGLIDPSGPRTFSFSVEYKY